MTKKKPNSNPRARNRLLEERVKTLEQEMEELQAKVRLLRGEYTKVGIIFDSAQDAEQGYQILHDNGIPFNPIFHMKRSTWMAEEGERYLSGENLKYKKYRREEMFALSKARGIIIREL